jgi:hypothetical protein
VAGELVKRAGFVLLRTVRKPLHLDREVVSPEVTRGVAVGGHPRLARRREKYQKRRRSFGSFSGRKER